MPDRQAHAPGQKQVPSFVAFAFAAHDGNLRYKRAMASKALQTSKDAGILTAIQTARNALLAAPAGKRAVTIS